MTVEAGCVLASVQRAAAGGRALLSAQPGSEGSCQIGGNLATNAGGVNVLRYGMARELVLGIEAVLPDGSVLRWPKSLRKDNTGYDLQVAADRLGGHARGDHGGDTQALAEAAQHAPPPSSAWRAPSDARRAARVAARRGAPIA